MLPEWYRSPTVCISCNEDKISKLHFASLASLILDISIKFRLVDRGTCWKLWWRIFSPDLCLRRSRGGCWVWGWDWRWGSNRWPGCPPISSFGTWKDKFYYQIIIYFTILFLFIFHLKHWIKERKKCFKT